MKVKDFWYDTPERGEDGRFVLALRFNPAGQVEVNFYLTVPEMKEALASLNHDEESRHPSPNNTNVMWWAYEYVTEQEDYGTWGDHPPVLLYRDDHFTVTLPHAVGEQLREVLARRLKEVE
jgi:hypothetical protein